MSKNKFIGLIIMMLISITGIIWVQMIWISNALEIRNDIFNKAVYASLNDAAETIETNRKMDFFFNSPVTYNSGSSGVSSYMSVGSYSSRDGKNFSYSVTSQSVTGTVDSTGNLTFNEPVITRTDTTFYQDPIDMEARSSLQPSSPPVSSNDIIEHVRRRASEFQTMSEQIIAEVSQWERTMELDNNEIQNILGRSLRFSNIETPFEFAVIRDGVIREGNFRKGSKDDFLKSNYMIRLFPDNIMGQNLILSVIFPEKRNYVLGSMAWILSGSMLFSLIILATFALSLFFLIRQKKISEMKSDFLNNMTHEFKTPIATISLAADTITNPKVINDENSIRHFIGMIKKENSRMNKKVETILQIASLDKKEIDFRFENVSMHSIITRAAEAIEIQVHQKNGSLDLRLNASAPVVSGDPEHLFNLVNNLLDNALKYSPEIPEITVETSNNDRGLILSVSDKGIGMSKSVQSKIFERFYRQTSGNIHDVKGFGLGLNYVRAIVDAHRGTVTITSEPGKGSRFDVFLPFNNEN